MPDREGKDTRFDSGNTRVRSRYHSAKKTNILSLPIGKFSMNDLLLAGRKKDILRSAVTNVVGGSNALTCLMVGVSQRGVRGVHEKPL